MLQTVYAMLLALCPCLLAAVVMGPWTRAVVAYAIDPPTARALPQRSKQTLGLQ